MNYFKITFNGASGDQAIVIDKLKNSGHDVIQVSSGLLSKSSGSIDAVQNEVKEMQGISVEQLDLHQAATDDNLSKDAKIFLGIE